MSIIEISQILYLYFLLSTISLFFLLFHFFYLYLTILFFTLFHFFSFHLFSFHILSFLFFIINKKKKTFLFSSNFWILTKVFKSATKIPNVDSMSVSKIKNLLAYIYKWIIQPTCD